MTVVRITMQRHGTHKPAATTGRSNIDLAPELVAFVCLPLADAFHQWLVNTVHFILVVSLLSCDPLRSHS